MPLSAPTAPPPASRFLGFGSEISISLPVMQVAAALDDHDGAHRWVARCGASRLLSREAEEPGRIVTLEYHRTRGLPLVADRHLVIEATMAAEHGPQGAQVRVAMRARPLPAELSRADVVDVVTMTGHYILRPQDNGHTHVTYWTHVDPGGALWPSIVNRMSTRFPRDTLRGLARAAEQPAYAAAAPALASALGWPP